MVVVLDSVTTMLHSAAPQPFNMFPFGHPPQHPPTSHHGDMFSHAPSHHHTVPQPPQPPQAEVPPKPRFLFKMPRVVPNQREKFESDEFLKRHSREGEVSLKVRHTSLLHRCSAADHSDVGADDGEDGEDGDDNGDDDGDVGPITVTVVMTIVTVVT